MASETRADNSPSDWNREQLLRVRGALDGPPLRDVGPFHLLEKLGVGGMGEVWKAERRTPIHQIVAVKIIRPGLGSSEIIARFDSERQALARMNHPGVARVLDAGTTESGRPYFVMEYVPGAPLTRFADDNKLDIGARLRLFTDVCEAVAHAHQKAIIHRDIKASNVLGFMQDGKPAAKVIDFGVAKALTGDKLTDQTLVTALGQAVGTLDSMSPEQADGSPDIDTRTDVYSLGVLLYELLTGAKPFDVADLARAGNQEMLRIIREVEPLRPGARVSSLKGQTATSTAAARRVDVTSLARTLRSELEWIPLKAMRKERDRRYPGALEIAEDIRRYLAGLPLLAGPETRAYRFRKFVRRRRGALVAAAAVVLAIVGGLIGTSWQAIRATRAERAIRVEQQRTLEQMKEVEAANANAQALNDFLTVDLLASAAPEVTRGEELTVVEALDRAAERVGEKFKDRPEVEASVRGTIAETYDALGKPERALPHATASLQLWQRETGPGSKQTLGALNSLVQILIGCDRLDEAEVHAREVANVARNADAPFSTQQRITALSNLAHVLHTLGKYEDAERAYRETRDVCMKLLGPDNSETATATGNVASILQSMGRLEEAEPLYRECLERRRRTAGDDDPDTIISAGNLALCMSAQGRYAEGIALQRDALARARRVLGNEHPNTLNIIRNLADASKDSGELDEAEALFEEALSTTRRIFGEVSLETIKSANGLGSLLQSRHRFAEAEREYRGVLENCRKLLGEEHPYTLITRGNLGTTILLQGRAAEAEPLLRVSYQGLARGESAPDYLARAGVSYGQCLAELGRWEEAERILLTAESDFPASYPDAVPTRRRVLRSLVVIFEHTSRPDEAAKYAAMLDALPGTQPTTSPGPASSASGPSPGR